MAATKPTAPASRIPGRATQPTYQRTPVERAADEISKALRRVPSDLAAGSQTVQGAVRAVKSGYQKVKASLQK